ncbi:MAG: hypothetical protein HYY04_05340 [Chloroflexi bacterium]|nr:hypothetical protein [Chloroflexota bacterium]
MSHRANECAPRPVKIPRRGILCQLGKAALLGQIAPIVAACRDAGSILTGGGGSRLRFAWWTDVGFPTPFRISTTGPGGAALLTLLYDTLTWKDDRGTIPWLAERWETSTDGRHCRFTLRDDVRWHDGQPVTVRDVAFSFTYYREHPFRWLSTEVVVGAEAVGPSTVDVLLDRPYAPFLEEIAGSVPIIPAHVWATVRDPERFEGEAATVGSGPFRLAEYRQAEGAYRLTAFPRYFRGRPTIDEFWQFVVPAEMRIPVVQRGQADLSLGADASVLTLLGGDRPRVFETAPQSVVRLAVNTLRPPLDDRSIRLAVALALDRAAIARTITKGPPVIEGTGVIPPETPWFNPAVAGLLPHAPDRARDLLAGRSVALELLADPSAREPELIQPMLEAVGIALRIRRADPKTRLQLLGEGSFQLALTSHIGVGGDPDFLRRWYTGEEANDFAQGFAFRHDEFARASEAQVRALRPEDRRAPVYRLQEIVATELPTITLYHRRFYWVYDPARFRPFATAGGLLNGVPFPTNKLAFLT